MNNREEIIIKFFSEEKISTYKKSNLDDKIALKLYDWNIKLSEALYTSLNYKEYINR